MNVSFRKSNPLRFAPLMAGAGLAAVLALSPAMARAQGTTVLALYRGNTVETEGIQLSSWGSGTITPDTKILYGGSQSLKLVTHGLYQGASLTFMKPVDLGPYLTDKNAYLQFAIMPPVEGNATAGGNFPGNSGGLIGPGKGGGPGAPYGQGGGPAGLGNSGGVGSSGSGSGSGSVKFQKPHSLENVRVLMVTASGKALEMLVPISYSVDDMQWKLLNFPVSTIPGLKAEDAQIKEIRIFGDVVGIMYIGKIGVVTDANKIIVEPQDEKIVNPNVKYRYTVSATGGITPLQFSWDWDDRDGIQDESQGRSTSHIFRKSGDYKVTVTVTDPFGIKEPKIMKFSVHVP